jgi:catalase
MLTRVYSNYGIPANYRQMDGFGVHAFKWINNAGEVTYVKYTWKSLQGTQNFTAAEASEMQSKDFQHATVDLYDNIRKGNHPSWELYIQMLKASDFDKLDINPLDPTKIWPETIAPLQLLGKMTLNKIPDNFFQEVEQSAFSPGTLVPGIEPSEDKLLQGRLFSYFDTQRYRIGGNFQQLPVNAPKVPTATNNQDGAFAMRKTNGDINYQPSATQNGFTDNGNYKYPTSTFDNVTTVRQKISKPNDFKQAGEFYRSLSEKEKQDLITNLSDDLKVVTNKNVARKMVGYFYMADADYGKRLAKELNFTREEVEQLFSK